MTHHPPALSPKQRAAVEFIARAFRAGLPIRRLLDAAQERHGTDGWATADAQRAVLAATLAYAPANAPPSFTFGARRSARFARLLLDEVDHARAADLHESLLHEAAAACASPTPAPREGAHVSVVLELPRAAPPAPEQPGTIHAVLSVSELFSDLGMRVWEAALVLHAMAVAPASSLRADVRARRVLEIGSGTGLAAISLVEAGVEHAVLSDYTDDIVANLSRNVDQNILKHKRPAIHVEKLDVFDQAHFRDVLTRHQIDTVLAADVSYDPGLMQAVVRAFRGAVLKGACVGYLFATKRNAGSDELLDRELASSSMRVEQVSDQCDVDPFEYLCGWDLSRVRVFRLSAGDFGM